MSRLELIIDERDDPQQALKYYSALHELSISKGKQDIYLLLVDNKMKLQEISNECESEITFRQLQGAIQLIDDLLDKIEKAGEKLNEIRGRM